MDLRTRPLDGDMGTDLVMAAPQLEQDDGLETAVLISLFTDRLAGVDDVLPDDSGDRRGWFGDSFADVDGDLIGSRLWLLAREKQLPVVLQRAREYARESLQWLIEDGIARSVDVQAEFARLGVLALTVDVVRAVDGPVRFRFETFWGAKNAV